jgi:hypothetical protein
MLDCHGGIRKTNSRVIDPQPGDHNVTLEGRLVEGWIASAKLREFIDTEDKAA